MNKSEYIVWKCETLEQIKDEHPSWTKAQIDNYFSKVEAVLIDQGKIAKDF